jgi:molybdenum cofactor synthesis domain-containing protein
MQQDTAPTAAFIIIGNEILSGRTQDKNLTHLAHALNEAGIRLREVRVIADDEAAIIHTVNTLRTAYRYVFTSGGIGPTHDDITTDAVAKAFGKPARLHAEAKSRLEKHYAKTATELNEARLKMAHIPEGASLVDNPISAAPGFQLENVYVFAGVPSIFQAMLAYIIPSLVGGARMLSREIGVLLPEGTIAAPLAVLQARYPAIDIGSYPFMRNMELGTNLVLRTTDSDALELAANELIQILNTLGGKRVD